MEAADYSGYGTLDRDELEAEATEAFLELDQLGAKMALSGRTSAAYERALALLAGDESLTAELGERVFDGLAGYAVVAGQMRLRRQKTAGRDEPTEDRCPETLGDLLRSRLGSVGAQGAEVVRFR